MIKNTKFPQDNNDKCFIYFENIILNYYILQELSLSQDLFSFRQKLRFQEIKNQIIDKIFCILKDSCFQLIFDELSNYVFHSDIGKRKGYIFLGEKNYDKELYELASNEKLDKIVFELNPIEALKKAKILFSDYRWDDMYGSYPWHKLANILLNAFENDLNNDLNKIIFIEKILFFQHHSGLLFNRDTCLVTMFNEFITQRLLDLGREGKIIDIVKDKDYAEKILDSFIDYAFIEKELSQVIGKTWLPKVDYLNLYISKIYGNQDLVFQYDDDDYYDYCDYDDDYDDDYDNNCDSYDDPVYDND